jgi:hypothetical protein
VFSGWIWLFGLPSKAHCRMPEKLQPAYQTGAFNILEFHSGGGSGFINHGAAGWRGLAKTLGYT